MTMVLLEAEKRYWLGRRAMAVDLSQGMRPFPRSYCYSLVAAEALEVTAPELEFAFVSVVLIVPEGDHTVIYSLPWIDLQNSQVWGQGLVSESVVAQSSETKCQAARNRHFQMWMMIFESSQRLKADEE
jgi:hypothetical protein